MRITYFKRVAALARGEKPDEAVEPTEPTHKQALAGSAQASPDPAGEKEI